MVAERVITVGAPVCGAGRHREKGQAMSSGDPIKAGAITTAYSTTDLVAEQNWDHFHPSDFAGPVILRVGPSDNTRDQRVPGVTLDGIQGAGNYGGTGLVGLGGPVEDGGGVGVKGIAGGAADGVVGVSDAEAKSGVFGFNALAQGAQDVAAFGVFGRCDTPGGAGVGAELAFGVGARAHSAANDGVVGLSDAHLKSGVFGFNSTAQAAQNIPAYGVFGRCDTAGGAGVGAELAFGVGARAHSGANDGVVGLSDAQNKSGVYGFNSLDSGAAYGVFGRCEADEGAGVGADSSLGVGVRGHSSFNDAVVGLSDGKVRNGVFGFNSNTSGAAVGVLGQCNSPQGIGVRGSSSGGYGASFSGGLAPLRIEPASTKGSPGIGAHLTGELFVDSLGDLYFCKTGGVGPAALWVKLT